MATNDKVVLGALFPVDDAALIRLVADARGEDVSTFLRASVYRRLAELSYLGQDRKKALGVMP